jgi:hypothetical protein
MPEHKTYDDTVDRQQREVQEALMNMPEFQLDMNGIEETQRLERASFDIQPPED